MYYNPYLLLGSCSFFSIGREKRERPAMKMLGRQGAKERHNSTLWYMYDRSIVLIWFFRKISTTPLENMAQSNLGEASSSTQTSILCILFYFYFIFLNNKMKTFIKIVGLFTMSAPWFIFSVVQLGFISKEEEDDNRI